MARISLSHSLGLEHKFLALAVHDIVHGLPIIKSVDTTSIVVISTQRFINILDMFLIQFYLNELLKFISYAGSHRYPQYQKYMHAPGLQVNSAHELQDGVLLQNP